MASLSSKIEVERVLRPCLVRGEKALFHCWEHYSEPIGASPMVGGAPAGEHARVYAICEFNDGTVGRIPITQMQFSDNLLAAYAWPTSNMALSPLLDPGIKPDFKPNVGSAAASIQMTASELDADKIASKIANNINKHNARRAR